MIEIDEDLCKGCKICTDFCPKDVFETSDKINKKGYYPPIPINEDECIDNAAIPTDCFPV